MELFTRDLLLSGPMTEVSAWAGGIAEVYTAATGKDLDVWSAVAGAEAGLFTWAMPVDGTAELLELSRTATADDAWRAKVEEGRQYFAGAPRDVLMRPYFGDVPTDEVPMGAMAIVTKATTKAGSLGHAVGWAQELADFSTQLTGVRTTMYGTIAGPFSELVWVAVADDPRTADTMDRKLRADDEYRKLLARGGGYFMSGSAQASMHLRIA